MRSSTFNGFSNFPACSARAVSPDASGDTAQTPEGQSSMMKARQMQRPQEIPLIKCRLLANFQLSYFLPNHQATTPPTTAPIIALTTTSTIADVRETIFVSQT
ncbi:MAG: hypothetical protein R2825_11215 [Saprospiraceae bacterium]